MLLLAIVEVRLDKWTIIYFHLIIPVKMLGKKRTVLKCKVLITNSLVKR